MRSVLSALHEPKINKQRLTNYTSYESTLDMTEINYPWKQSKSPSSKKHNPTISINVLSFEPNTKSFTIEYLSPERGRQHHVNLMLLEYPKTPQNTITCA